MNAPDTTLDDLKKQCAESRAAAYERMAAGRRRLEKQIALTFYLLLIVIGIGFFL